MKGFLVALLIACAPCLFAQTVTLNDASTYAAQRIGINVGGNNYYSSYLLKNRAAGLNPGFQPILFTQNIEIASGTLVDSSDITFTDNDIYAGTLANMFAGGTWQIACHGAASGSNCIGGDGPATFGADPGTASNIGCYGTITSNTATDQGVSGAVYTVHVTACPATLVAPSEYDQVYVYAPKTPTASGALNFNDFGWNVVNTTVDTTSAHFPAGFTGVQVLQMNSTSSAASINTNYDSGGNATSEQPQYFWNGNYADCIQANILSGTSLSLTMTIARNPGPGINASGTVSIGGSGWHNYCVTLAGTESSGSLPSYETVITYALSGSGIVDIAEPSIISASDTSTTQYTNTMLANLATWSGGQLRYWAGNNAESLDNWIAPQYERLPSQNGVNLDGGTGYPYTPPVQQGLYDFLEGAIAAGIQTVNIVVPVTFRFNVDAQNLVDFLAGGSGTTYGAKRIALGQTAAFTTAFTKIILSYGNETWQGPPDGMSYFTGTGGACAATGTACWNYMGEVINFCGAMKLDANWNSSVMQCAATVQTAIPFFAQSILALDTHGYVDTYAANEYGLFDVTSPTSPSPWVSAFVEASQQNNHDTSSASFFNQMATAVYAAGKKINVYEGQNSTNSGTATQVQLLGLPEGEGYGLPDTLMALESNKTFGITDWDFFTLYQNDTGISTSGGASYINEWGAWTGPGGKLANPRAMVYAVAAVNGCIGTGNTGYATATSGVPTFNFTAANGINAESNVPYLWFYAFKNGGTRCLIAENIDTASGHTFTVSGTNPPSGTVTQVLYTGTSLTENNETPNSTPTNFNTTSTSSSPASFTVPANSIITETWTASGSNPVLAPLNFEGVTIGPGLQIQ